MNRKIRRALAANAKKQPVPAELARAQLTAAAYQEAMIYQQKVAELYGTVRSAIQFLPEDPESDEPSVARADLESDRDMLADELRQAQRHAIDCGLEFIEAICPKALQAPDERLIAEGIAAALAEGAGERPEAVERIIEEERPVLEALAEGPAE